MESQGPSRWFLHQRSRTSHVAALGSMVPVWAHTVEGQAWLHLCHSLPIKRVLASSDSGDKGARPALRQESVAFFIHHISFPTPAILANTHIQGATAFCEAVSKKEEDLPEYNYEQYLRVGFAFIPCMSTPPLPPSIRCWWSAPWLLCSSSSSWNLTSRKSLT